METTKSQILWSSDDLEGSDSGSGSGSGHVKSYTCVFCKRGFSNAQALGGHMNIHRKERAKLIRQFSEENLLSLDINAKANNQSETSESKEEKMKLQLGESSSSSHIIDQFLDLELRLGPEPREASAKITKNLFSH